MKKFRKELSLGLGFLALYFILSRFSSLPSFFLGGLMGLSLCLMLVGALPDKVYQRLKDRKKKLFRSAS
jgi:hypothetical protein